MSHETDRVKLQKDKLSLDTAPTTRVLWFLTKKHKFFLAVLVIVVQGTYIITHLGTTV